MTNKKRVLVAGATGYLGRYVVQEFKKLDCWVRVLARDPEKLALPGPFLEPAIEKMVDDVFIGEVTRPETMDGLCEGIDIVFSSIGITRQRDGLSFMDVDYQGNKNLLHIAQRAAVRRFIFISVYKADVMAHLAKAREFFVQDLLESGLEYGVIRPTGYFSDMSEYLRMAQSGRVYLFGAGQNKINPIHGEDLARVCVEVALGSNDGVERDVGGPEIFSHEEIGSLTFDILNKRRKITRIPMWLVRIVLAVIRPFSKQAHQMATFFATVMSSDFVAPEVGTHSLKEYLREKSLAK